MRSLVDEFCHYKLMTSSAIKKQIKDFLKYFFQNGAGIGYLSLGFFSQKLKLDVNINRHTTRPVCYNTLSVVRLFNL